MGGFFKEYEVNKTSRNKKIGWVFQQLLMNCDLSNIHSEYPDVMVTCENDQFIIKGTDFTYMFLKSDLNMIWKRMKKAIKN